MIRTRWVAWTSIAANLVVAAVLAAGVVRVATARTYDPWWPSGAFFWLGAATVGLLAVALLTSLATGPVTALGALALTTVEVLGLTAVDYAMHDDAYLGCPPPSGRQAGLVTDVDLVAGRVTCRWSGRDGAPTEITTYPVLDTLTGRL